MNIQNLYESTQVKFYLFDFQKHNSIYFKKFAIFYELA